MEVATDPRLGRRLKALREAAELTQQGLAERSGVSMSAISRIEAGHRDPSWGIVVKLARGLGVSLADFDVEPPPPKRRGKK